LEGFGHGEAVLSREPLPSLLALLSNQIPPDSNYTLQSMFLLHFNNIKDVIELLLVEVVIGKGQVGQGTPMKRLD
jgi:hypothetical protein